MTPIFYASLRVIPGELYESARIDGASQRQHLILSRLRTRGAVRITALSKELGEESLPELQIAGRRTEKQENFS